MPLYFFCGDQLLWSQLRSSKTGGAHGALAIFDVIVKRIKKEWPDVEIVLRGDAWPLQLTQHSPELLDYCDHYGYKYILGFSSNNVLKRMTRSLVVASKLFSKDSGSEESFRMFGEYEYQAGTWSCPRPVIVKAEWLPDGDDGDGRENTRYIVTNMLGTPRHLYEDVYCTRGDMENRINSTSMKTQ